MKIFWIVLIGFCSLFSSIVPCLAQTSNVDNVEIEARADIVEWRYKYINGHVYKRLYNVSTKEWIGDWILA